MRNRNVADVLDAGMCAGCGLCATSSADMQIDVKGYLRPRHPVNESAVNAACPGRQVEHLNSEAPYNITWGPLLSCQTGYAVQSEVRQFGSSGGVITSLLLHLLDNKKVDAIIQVGVSFSDPIRNSTYIHDNAEAVLKNAGSRYAPSAPLAVIRNLLGDGKVYGFVGKPCDVAGLRSFLHQYPQHQAQFPYLLSFICAGVPSELGTLDLLKKMGTDRSELDSFRYRGDGWPGLTKAVTRDGKERTLTYNESWGTVLNRHLQARCKVCADGIGEAADLVCADAWHEADNGYPSFEERDGRSLVLGRTRVGEALIHAAVALKVIQTEPYQISALEAIQPYQSNRKRTAMARKFAIVLLGGRVPNFRGYALMRAALHGGIRNNFIAFAGTLRRKLAGRI